MNGFEKVLSRAVASKAEMYGFPLIIWPSGGLQVHRFGMPDIVGVFCFWGGALLAMTIVVAVCCRGCSGPLPKRDPSIHAFGGIHVLSVLRSATIGGCRGRGPRGAGFLSSVFRHGPCF